MYHSFAQSLGVRRPVNFMTPSKFRKPGTGSPEPSPVNTELDLEDEGSDATAAPAPAVDEKPFEPLVLWEAGPAEDDHRINVDPRLCKWLRPHQREGVQFMFECGKAALRIESWMARSLVYRLTLSAAVSEK